MLRVVRKITFHASGAEAATVTSDARNVSGLHEGLVYIDVTAISGSSPTLDVTVEGSDASDGNFALLATEAQSTATGAQVLPITNFGEWIRVVSTIGGSTPSVTFKIIFVGKS